MRSTWPLVPGVRRFGQPVHHAVFPANAVKTVPNRQELVRLRRELDAVVGQHGMHFVRQIVEHAPQKIGRNDPFGPRVEFGKRHFTGAVDEVLEQNQVQPAAAQVFDHPNQVLGGAAQPVEPPDDNGVIGPGVRQQFSPVGLVARTPETVSVYTSSQPA